MRPPLPPNCPLFFEIKVDSRCLDGWYFSPYAHDRDPKNWSHDSDFPVDEEEWESETWFPVIASVCERYWRIEVERIMRIWTEEGRKMTPAELESMTAANDKLVAWREYNCDENCDENLTKESGVVE